MLHETHETSASQWICRALARDIRKANSYQSASAGQADASNTFFKIPINQSTADSVKFGADAFISKPFDVEKLFTHCFKLGPIILE